MIEPVLGRWVKYHFAWRAVLLIFEDCNCIYLSLIVLYSKLMTGIYTDGHENLRKGMFFGWHPKHYIFFLWKFPAYDIIDT